MLTPKDVHEKEFDTHRLREGYDTDQVDAFLDEVADTIAAVGCEWAGERSRRMAAESRYLVQQSQATAVWLSRARCSRRGTGLSTALERCWRGRG